MQVYVLYTSYPYEGGYIHGVFSSYEEADKYRNDEEHVSSPDDTYIQPLTVDKITQLVI